MIRKASNGVITTLAGVYGITGYAGDNGPATPPVICAAPVGGRRTTFRVSRDPATSAIGHFTVRPTTTQRWACRPVAELRGAMPALGYARGGVPNSAGVRLWDLFTKAR